MASVHEQSDDTSSPVDATCKCSGVATPSNIVTVELRVHGGAGYTEAVAAFGAAVRGWNEQAATVCRLAGDMLEHVEIDAVDGAPVEDTTRGALTRRIARTCERGLGINELSAVERFAALLLVHRTIPLALTALLAEELTP